MSDDGKYPDNKKRGLFGKRQRDEEAIKCVYAGPDYFAARTGRVYAGPERDGDRDRNDGNNGENGGENDAGIEEVYAGPAFFNDQSNKGPFVFRGMAPAAANTRFCPECGSAAREGDLFCRECGSKLSK